MGYPLGVIYYKVLGVPLWVVLYAASPRPCLGCGLFAAITHAGNAGHIKIIL